MGKEHVKLTVVETIGKHQCQFKAIAWRWRNYLPLASYLNIAYKLRENTFNGDHSIELELLGINIPETSVPRDNPNRKSAIYFNYQQRFYTCGVYKHGDIFELRIKNNGGKILAVQLSSPLLNHPLNSVGLLGSKRQEAQEVDISQPPYKSIIRAALMALSKLSSKD